MPIYEYACLENGHVFESWQKFSDPPIESCPTCGGPVRKMISESAFHLKGSGWYVTDYKKKSSTDSKQVTSVPCPAATEACKKSGCEKAEPKSSCA